MGFASGGESGSPSVGPTKTLRGFPEGGDFDPQGESGLGPFLLVLEEREGGVIPFFSLLPHRVDEGRWGPLGPSSLHAWEQKGAHFQVCFDTQNKKQNGGSWGGSYFLDRGEIL